MAKALPIESIEKSILLIRGHKVLLDVHLSALYGVTTKRLNEQVRRNRARFPEDFMFQLTAEKVANKGRAAVDATRRMPSPSRGSPCYQPS